MSFRSVEIIEVRAWGRTVGATTLDPTSRAYAFEYAPEWLDTGGELAPLHMPNRPGVFVFPALRRETFHGLPPLLADALPDRFGNALIDAWMAGCGISAAAVTPLDRLAYVAERAMGALEFRPPADAPSEDLGSIQLADLVATARSALRGERRGDEETASALKELIQVGTSAGGARPKAVIAYNPETSQVRSGQLATPAGYEHWLVKLDGVGADPTREVQALGETGGYGIVEYAYHLMATAAGIEMAECRLLPEGPRTHFMTKRFDRGPDGIRHHMLTLCALAHLDFNLAGAHGYEQYLGTIDELGLGAAAREQAFRRIVFNVAAVNRDDHTKNLAFLLPQGGDGWCLAPAYDVTFAHNPTGTWTRHHQMSVGGQVEGITRTDLSELGDRWAVPAHREVIDDVLAAVTGWRDHAATAGLAEERAEAIAAEHARHRPR